MGPNNTIALQGADVITYFTHNTYTKGSSRFQTTYNGTTWYFKNEKNRLIFEANPEQYIPQYHGFSALEMAKGNQIESLPAFWTIYNNKLYLNHCAKAHATWKKNKATYIDKSDIAWKAFISSTHHKTSKM